MGFVERLHPHKQDINLRTAIQVDFFPFLLCESTVEETTYKEGALARLWVSSQIDFELVSF